MSLGEPCHATDGATKRSVSQTSADSSEDLKDVAASVVGSSANAVTPALEQHVTAAAEDDDSRHPSSMTLRSMMYAFEDMKTDYWSMGTPSEPPCDAAEERQTTASAITCQLPKDEQRKEQKEEEAGDSKGRRKCKRRKCSAAAATAASGGGTRKKKRLMPSEQLDDLSVNDDALPENAVPRSSSMYWKIIPLLKKLSLLRRAYPACFPSVSFRWHWLRLLTASTDDDLTPYQIIFNAPEEQTPPSKLTPRVGHSWYQRSPQHHPTPASRTLPSVEKEATEHPAPRAAENDSLLEPSTAVQTFADLHYMFVNLCKGAQKSAFLHAHFTTTLMQEQWTATLAHQKLFSPSTSLSSPMPQESMSSSSDVFSASLYDLACQATAMVGEEQQQLLQTSVITSRDPTSDSFAVKSSVGDKDSHQQRSRKRSPARGDDHKLSKMAFEPLIPPEPSYRQSVDDARLEAVNLVQRALMLGIWCLAPTPKYSPRVAPHVLASAYHAVLRHGDDACSSSSCCSCPYARVVEESSMTTCMFPVDASAKCDGDRTPSKQLEDHDAPTEEDSYSNGTSPAVESTAAPREARSDMDVKSDDPVQTPASHHRSAIAPLIAASPTTSSPKSSCDDKLPARRKRPSSDPTSGRRPPKRLPASKVRTSPPSRRQSPHTHESPLKVKESSVPLDSATSSPSLNPSFLVLQNSTITPPPLRI